MAGRDSRRPSEWRRLFSIAVELIDQLRENAGGYDFEWSFGGGTAMMIQIGHRESHDIDIFLDDPQLLGFIDPSRSHLHFQTMPSDYLGDGLRFQKFAFDGIGEIDFIVAGALTATPFETRMVEGRTVRLETIPEIIAKKVYYRGSEANPRHLRHCRCGPVAIGRGRQRPTRASRTRRSHQRADGKAQPGIRQSRHCATDDHA
ncbi:nucleotidyl transferase AbiEii/AbiGii toxin family protein [Mesorhizobium australicum]|uniref:nucleotidyl transferase AbiEii/AbiGii toxin family protein n=1 Tax=Mesorhizobium australicum TaxID=536018 RepID=UPI0033353F74